MQLRPFGTSKEPVAIIGQGTWQIELARRPDALAALRAGLDLGMTHIDTAEMYGDGAAERVIAEAIRGRRAEVFLVSKVLPSNAAARAVASACEQSLRNLGTDRLDCYLLHWRGKVPLAETIAAFESLKRAGKICAWGVSNFDVTDLDEVSAFAGPPACNQVLYHPGERAIEHAVIPWCEAHGTAVVAYTPFGNSPALYAAGTASGRVLQSIAAAHGATPRQVALNFLLRYPNLFVIPKAARIEHARENAGAANFELTAAELGALDAAFGRSPRPRVLPTN
ncbi:MAG: aldo/keto reductase [Gammaproteobacteria bacterium]|nr:aldo/keto reductase [Gammaproteobacteria bacterium]